MAVGTLDTTRHKNKIDQGDGAIVLAKTGGPLSVGASIDDEIADRYPFSVVVVTGLGDTLELWNYSLSCN